MGELYKEAVRVPITPQIINQVRAEKKDHLLGEIRYYTSVDIALVHDEAGTSSLDLETQELRKGAEAQNAEAAQSSSEGETAQTDLFQENQTISILTFKESGASLNQTRISRDDEGMLGSINQEGDIFEINYPERQITLGFVLNQEKNWYDLEFAVEENEQKRIPLTLAGTRPHLLINYQTVFSNAGETRIQLNSGPDYQAGDASRLSSPVSSQPGTIDNRALPPAAAAEPVNNTNRSVAVINPADNTPVVAMEFVDNTGRPAAAANPVEDTALSVSDRPVIVFGQFDTDDSLGPSSFSEFPRIPPVLSPDETAAGEGNTVVLIMSGTGGSGLTPVADISGAGAETRASGYTIQVGAFREQKNAAAAYAALEQEGFSPLYEYHQNLTRVVIPAVDQKELARTREKVKALGFGDPYVRP
ncbi:MAG: SPOR domain-containing protein [Treponema sp.]|nr:SPOR domain-containing protein [Treponema sp.]